MTATATTTSLLPTAIRRMREDETSGRSEACRWVIKCWLKSYYEHMQAMRSPVLPPTYWSQQHALVTHLLEVSDTAIAHFPESADLFQGWACAEPSRGVLHYVYVKPAYRREGVAQRLVDDLFGDDPGALRCTHWTARRPIREAAERRRLVYDPYALTMGERA